ncbi:16S rRNA (uracil(1498)-N(3))-methyltransferase [Metabacillus sp. RGM 3146]|uniref:16S rRNA (uracil(1498)-N(3))-methyltransferase n=1 Tax=Metabacillus sp. RGM 3146 TaxID=3401092 RepID=UPI003B9B6B0B
MQRYFIHEKSGNLKDIVLITGEDVHHITRVMRLKEGGKIICISADGCEAECVIEELSDDSIRCLPLKWVMINRELPVKVTIASGLPKGDKLEWIIQKGTELGAFEFIPFNAARSIVKMEPIKAKKKVDRWQKIAKEAAEQSYRNDIPSIHEPLSFKELINQSDNYDVKILAYEESAKAGEKQNFAKALEGMQEGGKLLIVTGPEGGLTSNEASLLMEKGFIPSSFGPRILRTETAPLYALSAVSFYYELLR